METNTDTTTMTATDWVEETLIRTTSGQRAPFRLARMADCLDPDGRATPGAEFLYSVAHATAEAIEYKGEDFDPDTFNDDGMIDQIADGAPSVYTHERWQQFVDLGAYREDAEDFGGDLTCMAGMALCLIAQRLAEAIVTEYAG